MTTGYSRPDEMADFLEVDKEFLRECLDEYAFAE